MEGPIVVSEHKIVVNTNRRLSCEVSFRTAKPEKYAENVVEALTVVKDAIEKMLDNMLEDKQQSE